MYAAVLIEAPLPGDPCFYYSVPENLADLQPGCRVKVGFGSRAVAGYVMQLEESLPNFQGKIKPILALLNSQPVFNEEQLALARWLADYTICFLYQALRTVTGSGKQIQRSQREKAYFPVPLETEPDFKRALQQERIWGIIQQNPGITARELKALAANNSAVLKALRQKGLIQEEIRSVRRNPFQNTPEVIKHSVLNAEQKKALEQIMLTWQSHLPRIILLQGVTGSGKTEVYLRAVEQVLAEGRQAIYLVPEIALTPQLAENCYGRFGRKTAILHGRLSDGERYDEWERIKNGEVKLVLGTRLAVFAPLQNIGIIILDEEQDSSYKQTESPSYHVRDVAFKLAAQHQALVILGSATPALESYYRAVATKNYQLLTLSERAGSSQLPEVKIVNMVQEVQNGNTGSFSRRLIAAVTDRLHKREQIILLFNRRGYSTSLVCRECGLVLKCPHCEISLTYHKNQKALCHYCGYSVSFSGFCPDCQSPYIDYLGRGIQKVEKEVETLFPEARILRLDADSTARKGQHQQIYQDFKAGKADILLGTQMVSQGLDLPGVTLVGVVNADTCLNLPDFRAAERTFQLLTQVAGRAGRGSQRGEVLIQTFNPEHYAIKLACEQNYQQFYQKEIVLRRLLQYPPFVRMGRVLLWGREEKAVWQLAEQAGKLLQKNPDLLIIGPTPAPLPRIKDRFRYHILLKARSGQYLRNCLHQIKAELGSGNAKVTLVAELDPQDLM